MLLSSASAARSAFGRFSVRCSRLDKAYRDLLWRPRVQVDRPDLGYVHAKVSMDARTPEKSRMMIDPMKEDYNMFKVTNTT